MLALSVVSRYFLDKKFCFCSEQNKLKTIMPGETARMNVNLKTTVYEKI